MRLRLGDIVESGTGRIVVVGIRLHPIMGKLEAVCQKIVTGMDQTHIVLSIDGPAASKVRERNHSIAANTIERLASNAMRHAARCKLERTRDLYLAIANRYRLRAVRVRKLQSVSSAKSVDQQGGSS